MADRFCLLDLNEKCIKTVLQCSELFDLISFSLCSKKKLANVRSLKLHIGIKLFCDTTFNAQFEFGANAISLFFCEDGYDREIAISDFQPRRLQVDYIEGEKLHWQDEYTETTIRRWRKANYQGNDWLRHFMSVFNCNEIRLLSVRANKFEIDSFMDTVQNLSISKTMILETVSKQHTLSLLRALPCLEDLSVDSLSFDESSEYSILLRNQQKLIVGTEAKITLDIVLSVNSLALNVSEWPIKDVNRFIKLWKKGANPRLRFLYISFFANPHGAVVLNENNVLRGVQYKRMPQGTVRIFVMPADRMEIDRGFDIVGKTGRKATVSLENTVMFPSFRMYIWQ